MQIKQEITFPERKPKPKPKPKPFDSLAVGNSMRPVTSTKQPLSPTSMALYVTAATTSPTPDSVAISHA